MTIQLTDAQIERGLNELEQFVPTYVWLQEHVRRCDVRTDREFRTTFNGFYRVRQKSAAWYDSYFRLMEKCKERAYTFDEVLRELYLETKEVHASFCSKLVATLDSTKPVIDSVVLGKFGLRLPPYNARDRLARCGVVHRRLCDCQICEIVCI